MLQQDRPDDYVIGTGEVHTVREFVEAAFSHVGLDWEQWVAIDPRYYRPTEVDDLRANPSKAKRQLGWEPKVTFRDLVKLMVDHDVEIVRGGTAVPSAVSGKPIASLAA